MLIYHASNITVEEPRLIHQNRFLDFGFGFYTTLNFEQAKNFAEKVTHRRQCGIATINIYDFKMEQALRECLCCTFQDADEKWLNFVCQHRMNQYTGEAYDIISGPVANDDVYTTVTAYMNGTFPLEVTLAALKIKKLFHQTVFASEKSLCFLHFEGVITL